MRVRQFLRYLVFLMLRYPGGEHDITGVCMVRLEAELHSDREEMKRGGGHTLID